MPMLCATAKVDGFIMSLTLSCSLAAQVPGMGPAGPKPTSFTTDAAATGVTSAPTMMATMDMTTVENQSLCLLQIFFILPEWM